MLFTYSIECTVPPDAGRLLAIRLVNTVYLRRTHDTRLEVRIIINRNGTPSVPATAAHGFRRPDLDRVRHQPGSPPFWLNDTQPGARSTTRTGRPLPTHAAVLGPRDGQRETRARGTSSLHRRSIWTSREARRLARVAQLQPGPRTTRHFNVGPVASTNKLTAAPAGRSSAAPTVPSRFRSLRGQLIRSTTGSSG